MPACRTREGSRDSAFSEITVVGSPVELELIDGKESEGHDEPVKLKLSSHSHSDIASMPDDPHYPPSQVISICWLRVSHPMCLKLVFPYIVEMTQSLLPDVPVSKIGSYTGAMEGCYALATSLLALFVASLSNRYGRKRVVIWALLGSWATSTAFGFSRAYILAFALRTLAGSFQTAQPILRALMAESSTKESEATNFGYFAASFWLGVTVAPIIGGALSNPATRYDLFRDSALLRAFPYALPGCVAGLFMLAGIAYTAWNLRETYRAGYSRISDSPTDTPVSPPPTLSTKEGFVLLLTTRRTALFLFSWVASMLVHSSFDAVGVLYAATPIAVGGLGLTTAEIGAALTINALCMICVVIFPRLKNRFGMQTLARATCGINAVLFLSMIPWHAVAQSIPDGHSRWQLWAAMSLTLFCRSVSQLPVMALEIVGSTAAPTRELNSTFSALMSSIGNGAWALGPLVGCSIFASTISVKPDPTATFWILSGLGLVSVVGTWPIDDKGGWRYNEAHSS